MTQDMGIGILNQIQEVEEKINILTTINQILSLEQVPPNIVNHLNELPLKVQLCAVAKDGYLLKYIENQTEEMCKNAINQSGNSYRHVKNPTEEMGLMLIKKDCAYAPMVKNFTIKMAFYIIDYCFDSGKYIPVFFPELLEYKFDRKIYYKRKFRKEIKEWRKNNGRKQRKRNN